MLVQKEIEENITLITSEKKEYIVNKKIVLISELVKNLIEDGCDGSIYLENVSNEDLEKIIIYCKNHVDDVIEEPVPETVLDNDADFPKQKEFEDFSELDQNFIDMDIEKISSLVMAANFMIVNGLIKLCCHKIANLMKGKTTEEMRILFNVTNDFTPEEEQKLREELLAES